jgi:surfeit locus 1 family protein
MLRILAPLSFGIAGIAVLLWLGTWQVERLQWKRGILADIDARIAAAPMPVPATPDPVQDRYQPVALQGEFMGDTLRVLVSQKQIGAGYRLITALNTDIGPVLVDRGFVPVAAPMPPLPQGPVQVAGNLHWPDDRNSATPENDVAGNTWFARDVAQMAVRLQTRPLLVVARQINPAEAGVTPLPVDSSAIPNDHLNYAITWYSLAVVWAAMTLYFLWRNRRPKTKA